MPRIAVQPDVPVVGVSDAGNLFDLEAADPVLDGNCEKPGDPIERYRLIEVLGEGSFGMVWCAEQQYDSRYW